MAESKNTYNKVFNTLKQKEKNLYRIEYSGSLLLK